MSFHQMTSNSSHLISHISKLTFHIFVFPRLHSYHVQANTVFQTLRTCHSRHLAQYLQDLQVVLDLRNTTAHSSGNGTRHRQSSHLSCLPSSNPAAARPTSLVLVPQVTSHCTPKSAYGTYSNIRHSLWQANRNLACLGYECGAHWHGLDAATTYSWGIGEPPCPLPAAAAASKASIDAVLL
jgi:hypothetical protein